MCVYLRVRLLDVLVKVVKPRAFVELQHLWRRFETDPLTSPRPSDIKQTDQITYSSHAPTSLRHDTFPTSQR
jgi:hypothetical protein